MFLFFFIYSLFNFWLCFTAFIFNYRLSTTQHDLVYQSFLFCISWTSTVQNNLQPRFCRGRLAKKKCRSNSHQTCLEDKLVSLAVSISPQLVLLCLWELTCGSIHFSLSLAQPTRRRIFCSGLSVWHTQAILVFAFLSCSLCWSCKKQGDTVWAKETEQQVVILSESCHRDSVR